MSWDKIIKALAAAAGAVAGLFGEWNTMLTILATAMALDYVSGLIVAACGKSRADLPPEGQVVSSAMRTPKAENMV